MSTHEDDLRAANQRFYQALRSADRTGMRGVWSTEGMVTCVHPGTPLIAGWDDVMETWNIIMDDIAQWQIEVEEQWIDVHGDYGWAVSVERFEAPLGTEPDEDLDSEDEAAAEAIEGLSTETEGGDSELEQLEPDKDKGDKSEEERLPDPEEHSANPEPSRRAAVSPASAREEQPGKPTRAKSSIAPAMVEGAFPIVLDEGDVTGEDEEDDDVDDHDDEVGDDDEEDDDDPNRRLLIATHVFRREAGEWKLIHRHSSTTSTEFDTPGVPRGKGPAN